MAKTVTQLLKKKKFTGKEVGQAYLITLSEQKKAQKAGTEFKAPFSRADLDRMEDSIQTMEQYIPFKCYSNLYRSLVDTANMAEAHKQQFYNGYYRSLYALKDCMQADAALKAVESYPLIMTQKQFDNTVAELKEYRRSWGASVYSIVTDFIQDYVEEPLEAPEHIQELIEATKEELCTNEEILKDYRENWGESYSTLPDGTRSDSMNKEEWWGLIDRIRLEPLEEALGRKPTHEEIVLFNREEKLEKLYPLFFKDDEELEEILYNYNPEWEEEFSLHSFKEAIREEVEDNGAYNDIDESAQQALKHIIGCHKSIIEHHYTEPTEPLSKYTALTEFDFFVFYSYEDNGKKLQEDYPELFKAVYEEVKKVFPDLAKAKDFEEDLFTYGELADNGLERYATFIKDITDADIIDFYTTEDTTTEGLQKRRRGIIQGLAIIRDKDDSLTMHLNINKNGDYEEKTNPYTLLYSIDSITDNEDIEEDTIAVRAYLAEPALMFVYAYNALIDILAEVYDVECIKELKAETNYFESQVDGFNKLLYMFYVDVYGDLEERERKRKLIKQVFQPIEVEELKPTPEAIENVKKKIADTFCNNNGVELLQDFLPLLDELQEGGAVIWQSQRKKPLSKKVL